MDRNESYSDIDIDHQRFYYLADKNGFPVSHKRFNNPESAELFYKKSHKKLKEAPTIMLHQCTFVKNLA